jgi:hypothetical protein
MQIRRHSKIAITMEIYTMVPDKSTLAALKQLSDALKHSQGRLKPVRPAKPLKPRRDLGVIQVRMIAAAGADQLIRVGVAASTQPSTMRTGWFRRTASLPWPGRQAGGGVTTA